jgi:hypothetical protein
MDFKQQIPEIDTKIKVVSVLSVVLITGFLATNTPTLQDHSQAQKLDKPAGSSGLAYNAPVRAEGDSGSQSGTDSGSSRKVITTVRTTLKVSNVDSAMKLIESEVNSYNGFIESSSIDSGSDNTGRMTVAVPAEDLEEFESGLEDNWKVDSRNVDREDVTDSYNQLETEIESLKTEHQRLKELINQTDDVENLIRLQERMSQVRSQINYKQERLDRMDENIEYSKVHITLEGPQSFESKFELRETLSDAYSALFDSVKLIIVGTAYLLPVAAIYGIYRIGIRVKRERL